MLLIAYIAIFSLIRGRLKNLGVLSLLIKVIRIGKNAKDTFHKHSASKTHTDMDKEINVRGTPRRRKQKVTNLHYYHVELFVVAIDALLAEMNHRFSETSSELLVCMVAFNPRKILMW